MDNELLSLQEDPTRAAGYLEAHHEHRILLLCSHVLHVENGRATLQHPRRRYYDTRSLCCSPTIIPAVNPVSHLTGSLEHRGVPKRGWIFQQHLHRVQGHSIDENRMLEV